MSRGSVDIELLTRDLETGDDGCQGAVWVVDYQARREHVCAGAVSWYRLDCIVCGVLRIRLCGSVRQTLLGNQADFKILCPLRHEAISMRGGHSAAGDFLWHEFSGHAFAQMAPGQCGHLRCCDSHISLTGDWIVKAICRTCGALEFQICPDCMQDVLMPLLVGENVPGALSSPSAHQLAAICEVTECQ